MPIKLFSKAVELTLSVLCNAVGVVPSWLLSLVSGFCIDEVVGVDPDTAPGCMSEEVVLVIVEPSEADETLNVLTGLAVDLTDANLVCCSTLLEDVTVLGFWAACCL